MSVPVAVVSVIGALTAALYKAHKFAVSVTESHHALHVTAKYLTPALCICRQLTLWRPWLFTFSRC